jgi:hypothetical protein
MTEAEPEPGFCERGHARGDHYRDRRCQGVQWVVGGHIEMCGCKAYVYSQGHTEIMGAST